MTENSIAYALHLQYRAASELTIPRFTPLGWWECDFFRVTNSGFTSEFEIKLSASDYKSDFSKEKGEERCWDRDLRKLVQHAAVGKHDLLAEMAATGKPIPSRPGPGFPPNRFYFVLPREIAEKVEIPDYAGLVIAKPYGKRVLVDVAKKAPQLHKAKAAPEGGWTQALADSFYHRYWSGIGKLSRVTSGRPARRAKRRRSTTAGCAETTTAACRSTRWRGR